MKKRNNQKAELDKNRDLIIKKIDLEVLDVFGGTITNKNNLLFKGKETETFTIIFDDDFTELRTNSFIKIVSPANAVMIDKAYLFNSIKDALFFYILNGKEYFYSSVIIITDTTANKFAVDYIRKNTIKNLVFFHRPDKVDLYFAYFDLIGDKVDYTLAINDENQSIVHFIYKTHILNLKTNQLSQAVDLLGKDERFYRVKNRHLVEESVIPQLAW